MFDSSLRRQLTLIFCAVVLAVVTLFALTTDRLLIAKKSGETSASLRRQAALLCDTWARAGKARVAQDDSSWTLVTEGGEVLEASPRASDTATSTPPQFSVEHRCTDFDSDEIASATAARSGVIVRLAVPAARLRQHRSSLLGSGLIVLVASLVLGLPLFSLVTSRIDATFEARFRHLETVRRDFVSNVSHELKTPLAACSGMLETVLEDPSMDEAVRRRFLDRIQSQMMRLSALVNDLLSLSRLEAAQNALAHEPVDVSQVVEYAIESLQPALEARQLGIESKLPDGPTWTRGDEAVLQQAIVNLLDNAIKYSPERTRVEIRLEVRDSGLCLEVEDRGPGIAPEHQARIFERFYRVDEARSRELGGTGLGLAIVKHAALAMNGHIEIDSKPGSGSTFRLILPSVDNSTAGSTTEAT